MTTIFIILLVLAMAGVVGVLVAGMVGMARSEGDPRRSNKLMQWRVILQATALVIAMILIGLIRS
jgi:hypothetical protein